MTGSVMLFTTMAVSRESRRHRSFADEIDARLKQHRHSQARPRRRAATQRMRR